MLEVTSVDLRYGAAIALRQVSLRAEIGAVTCLLGRNGVGKTSLLRAVTGAHPGQRRVDPVGRRGHHPPADLRPRPARHRLRAAGPRHLPVADRAREPRDRVRRAAARQRRIPDEIFDLFPILKTMMRRRGGDLSGGQQQQLAIGRALVMKPTLLVLDEPTEGIQPSIIKDIGRVIALLRARGTMAILLVEQYFDFARDLAQRIAVMDRGDIVVNSTREELDEPDVRRRLSV